MGKPSAPTPPDPQETAAAQTGQNVGTSIANTVMGQVNQVGPDGSLTYDQTGTYQWRDPNSGAMYNLPQYTATTTLSEDAQALRDASNRGNLAMANLGADQAERVGGILGDPFDPNSITPERADRSGMAPVDYGSSVQAPDLQGDARALPQASTAGALPEFGSLNGNAGLQTSYENDFGAQKQEIVDGLMGQLNEQRGTDMEALRSQLANQGVVEGSEAYSRAMEDFDRSVDDRRLSALLAGGQEQTRLVNMARDEAQFGNTALQQGLTNENNATMYGDDRSAQSFSMGEDVRRYDDAQEIGLFGMGSDQLAFNNNVGQQGFANEQSTQARDDQVANNNFNEQRIIADDQDRARAGALDEAYAARAQPINEIAALLSGSQVQTPQFSMAQPYAMPTTDVAGITQQGFNNDMANYQQQNANWQAMMGGLFGLGSAAVGRPA